MNKSIFEDENAYISATLGLIGTILVTYMLFIAVFPTAEAMTDLFKNLLVGNQFYTNTLAERLDTSLAFGWKMPFVFIGIGFVFIFVRTIIKQRYTHYDADE